MPDSPILYTPKKKEISLVTKDMVAKEKAKIDSMKDSEGYNEYMLEQERSNQSLKAMKEQGDNDKFMQELDNYRKNKKKPK